MGGGENIPTQSGPAAMCDVSAIQIYILLFQCGNEHAQCVLGYNQLPIGPTPQSPLIAPVVGGVMEIE